MDDDSEPDGASTDGDRSDITDDDTEGPTDRSSPPERPAPTRPPTTKSVLGGAMLGVGAIFNPNNVGPDSHWSQAPKVVLEVESRADESGLDLDDSNVPATPPRQLTPRRRGWRWFRRQV